MHFQPGIDHGAKVDVTLARLEEGPSDRKVGAACCDAR